ncbi:hypothetical protein HY256_09010 [Candidatus Sumerlaeota bacterium]|nr:hypothetical protein [Candidatus Sumerlaeota bacterium]
MFDRMTDARCLLGTILWLTAISAARIGGAAEPVPYGKPLDEAIVSVYVPPTRSANPVVATRRKVWLFDDDRNEWKSIYQAAPSNSGIEAVTGYAKSSKVLYIAHGGGVARTRDMGQSWDEFVPPGFINAENFVALIVNPTNRDEAILVLSQQAWMTKDYGITWKPFPLPSAAEPLTAILYTGGDEPRLVAGTTHALYAAQGAGKPWMALMRSVQGPLLLAVAVAQPFLYAYDILPSIQVHDLSRPGNRLIREIEKKSSASTMAADIGGRGAVWLGIENEIVLANLQSEGGALTLIHHGESQIRNLSAHPRQPNGIIWSEGTKLLRLYNALGEAGKVAAGPIPAEAFQKSELPARESSNPQGGQEGDQSDQIGKANKILGELMAQQPPVEEVVGAALNYANYRPKETERWKANVRRRNLLPTLKIMAGRNQISADQNKTVTQVDRYGTPSLDDIRQNDAIKDVDSFRVELGWNLSNLLFDREETKVSEETRRRAESRNQLITEITQLYFNRLELLVEQRLKQDSASTDETIRLALRINETTALLNEICGKKLF